MSSREQTSEGSDRAGGGKFVDLLAAISRTLTRTPDARVKEGVASVLGLIGDALEVDRVSVWRNQPDGRAFALVGEWEATDFERLPKWVVPEEFPWVSERLQQGDCVTFSDLEELPSEAAVDRRSFERLGTRSHYSCPLRVADETIGVLSLSTTSDQRRDWSALPAPRLRLIGDAIAGALTRSQSFSEVHESEERYRSFVENSAEGMWCMEFGGPISLDLPGEEIVTEIYNRGYMVEANDAFAQTYGYESASEMGVWRLKDRLPKTAETMEVIRAAVKSDFICEDLQTVELDRDGNRRIILNNLDGQVEGGKLVRIWGTQRDVTDLRRQEKELSDLKNQLARVVRLGTLGELTAAVAHEIGQPLAAIGANAEAAKRFLESPDPNLTEVSEILEDIIEDDLRAAAVTQRMRALLSAQETPRSSFRIEDLVQSVSKLLRSDTIFRNVELSLELEEDLPCVWCDAVQIQQVVINLVLNGCEAMEEVEPEDRRIVIRVARESAEQIRVSVEDCGNGLGGTSAEKLFAPFETSKPRGLGMGLSISRTIVKNHGGRIWGDENPDGGATFHFTLPIADAAAETPDRA